MTGRVLMLMAFVAIGLSACAERQHPGSKYRDPSDNVGTMRGAGSQTYSGGY